MNNKHEIKLDFQESFIYLISKVFYSKSSLLSICLFVNVVLDVSNSPKSHLNQ